jgi:hypothetical protein
MLTTLFLVAWLLIVAFVIYRNEWVYRVRAKITHEDHLNYFTSLDNGSVKFNQRYLPSYNSMLFRFWIWDIEKFIQSGE